jgi:hypothetical protein
MEEKKEEKVRSFIHIEFAEPNSVLRNITFSKDINPYQVCSVLEELKIIAQSGIIQQMQQQASDQILVPKPQYKL